MQNIKRGKEFSQELGRKTIFQQLPIAKILRYFLLADIILFSIAIISLLLIGLKWQIGNVWSTISYFLCGIIALDILASIILATFFYNNSLQLQRYHRVVIESWFSAKTRVESGPSIVFIMPWEKWIHVVSIAKKTIELEPMQKVFFADGLFAKIEASVTLQVGKIDESNLTEEEKEKRINQSILEYIYKYSDLTTSLEQIIRSEVSNIAGRIPLTSLTQKIDRDGKIKLGFMENRQKVEEEIRSAIQEELGFKGTKIIKFSITNIEPDKKAKDVAGRLAHAKTKADMCREDAEGEADARRKKAEGEADATLKEIEAIGKASQMIITEGVSNRDALGLVMQWKEQEKDKFIAQRAKSIHLIQNTTGKKHAPRIRINLDLEDDSDNE